MTFYVDFYADQAFLLFVKQRISEKEIFDVQDGAVCVISSAAALEAIVNQMFILKPILKYYDSLRFKEKIETLCEFGGTKISWGEEPWQTISELGKVRNWLIHYKDTTIGLMNNEFQWVVGGENRKPRMDPDIFLSKAYSEKYYKSVLDGALRLANYLDVSSEFDSLSSQDYNPIIS